MVLPTAPTPVDLWVNLQQSGVIPEMPLEVFMKDIWEPTQNAPVKACRNSPDPRYLYRRGASTTLEEKENMLMTEMENCAAAAVVDLSAEKDQDEMLKLCTKHPERVSAAISIKAQHCSDLADSVLAWKALGFKNADNIHQSLIRAMTVQICGHMEHMNQKKKKKHPNHSDYVSHRLGEKNAEKFHKYLQKRNINQQLLTALKTADQSHEGVLNLVAQKDLASEAHAAIGAAVLATSSPELQSVADELQYIDMGFLPKTKFNVLYRQVADGQRQMFSPSLALPTSKMETQTPTDSETLIAGENDFEVEADTSSDDDDEEEMDSDEVYRSMTPEEYVAGEAFNFEDAIPRHTLPPPQSQPPKRVQMDKIGEAFTAESDLIVKPSDQGFSQLIGNLSTAKKDSTSSPAVSSPKLVMAQPPSRPESPAIKAPETDAVTRLPAFQPSQDHTSSIAAMVGSESRATDKRRVPVAKKLPVASPATQQQRPLVSASISPAAELDRSGIRCAVEMLNRHVSSPLFTPSSNQKAFCFMATSDAKFDGVDETLLTSLKEKPKNLKKFVEASLFCLESAQPQALDSALKHISGNHQLTFTSGTSFGINSQANLKPETAYCGTHKIGDLQFMIFKHENVIQP